MYTKRIAKFSVILFALCACAAAQWRTLEPGLEFGVFRSPHYGQSSGATVNVLRIDPKRFELCLFNAAHPEQGGLLTAKGWAQKENLLAVINAAMYQADYRTSVSHMKTSKYTNNARISKDKTILLFEPLQNDIPPVRLVDAQCDDFEQIKPLYGSAVQSIRMLSCEGKNVWQESEKRWSIVSVGIDKTGNLLFIQCTAPHSVHEFVNVLRKLPIALDRAMYMEGGSPSQMYIGTEKEKLEFIGDFSSGGKPTAAAELPNVIGIRRAK